MGTSKNMYFDLEQVALANTLKALGHPARIAIYKLLLNRNHQSCLEIVNQIPLAQATVSQHLAELKRVGLLFDKKVSNKVYYSINKETIPKIDGLFKELLYGQIYKSKQQTLF